MRIENLNKSFSNIGTVVFYKHHPYIPESIEQISGDSSQFKSDLVKYHGSRDNFHGINFAEYDFSYLIEKYKFSNRLLISDLDTESLEIVGKDINSTDKIEKVLFPTLVNEESDTSGNEFFGSLSINGRDLYFLECPENYQTIEIYEDVLVSNVVGGDGFLEYDYLKISGEAVEVIPPAVIIYLGPAREAYNNPTNFYYDLDPLRPRAARSELEYTTLEYSRLCDEIFSSKVVSFFLATTGNLLDINLSWAAWENNSNPERNKWKYEIRNDEFYDLLGTRHEIIDTSKDLWIDKKSGTILGNTEVPKELCPILKNKLDRLSETQSSYYSPYRTYQRGDTTIYKVIKEDGVAYPYIYESLVPGNIGNDPLLSPAWILRDRFLDFRSSIIYISQDPASCGSVIDPGTSVTVKNNSQVEFIISDGLGWMFSGISVINPNTSEETDLTRDDDYMYNLIDNETEYFKTVEIGSWSQFLDPESPKYTDNLVFKFTERPSIIKFLLNKDGAIYHYREWESIFGDNFGMTLSLNGEIIEPPSQDNEYSAISYVNGDMFLFINNPQLNPTLEITFTGGLLKNNIKSKYTKGKSKYTKVIPVVSNTTATDVIDFSDSEYIIEVSSVERYLYIEFDRQYVQCSNFGFYTIDNGSSKTLKFTTTPTYRPRIVLINFQYSNGRMIKYDNELNIETIPTETVLELDGTQTAAISLDQSEEGVYSLDISGIVENLVIIIDAIKIEY